MKKKKELKLNYQQEDENAVITNIPQMKGWAIVNVYVNNLKILRKWTNSLKNKTFAKCTQ